MASSLWSNRPCLRNLKQQTELCVCMENETLFSNKIFILSHKNEAKGLPSMKEKTDHK